MLSVPEFIIRNKRSLNRKNDTDVSYIYQLLYLRYLICTINHMNIKYWHLMRLSEAQMTQDTKYRLIIGYVDIGFDKP